VSILDRFRLDGKTALVTGARRGIGRALAIALAEAGADIVAASAHMEPDGGDLARDITQAGRKCWAYAMDLGDRGRVYDFIARVKRECPPVDILINNGGTILRKPAAEHPDEYWDRVIEVDLNAQWILAREFGRDMVERGAGKIIFTASVLSFQGGITVPGYAAAKGGIAQLTKALANEWASRGVQVNAIAPGYIATENTEALRADSARNAAILSRIPAGRWGQPSDLQGSVVYLASSASDYVNGTIVTVDGGWMAR
jgi:2-dehydro-3-deoxy-D-gluconate 5-dehydrogenase